MKESYYDKYLDPLVEVLGPVRVEMLRKEIRAKIPPDENRLILPLSERLLPVTIAEFIKLPIPRDWARWTIEKRRHWWKGINVRNSPSETSVKRDRVCATEIWCELYGRPRASFRQTHTRAINKELSRIPGLVRMRMNGSFGPYGIQRGFYILQSDDKIADA